MKRKSKILLIIILIVFGIFFVNYEVFATTVSGQGLVSNFNGSGDGDVSAGTTLIQKIIDPILSVVRIVAIGIGVIMITFLGIKYMSAAPTEKANIKTQLITFTIGFVIVVGTTTILQIVNKAVDEITKAG